MYPKRNSRLSSQASACAVLELKIIGVQVRRDDARLPIHQDTKTPEHTHCTDVWGTRAFLYGSESLPTVSARQWPESGALPFFRVGASGEVELPIAGRAVVAHDVTLDSSPRKRETTYMP